MSTLDGLATALEGLIGPEYLLTDATVADYAIDGTPPTMVAFPADEAQVSAVLRLAAEHQATVFARGGGSHLHIGGPPAQVDLVLCVQRLQQHVAYEPADMTTTVQAGVRLDALQQRLHQGGQRLALDPPSTPETTVGGIVAANRSGPRRLLYGTARDVLLGSAVLTAAGTRVKAGGRVVKNVTGYDLNKLYIGSFGTLGILVELTFKLHPLPPGEVTVALGCQELADLLPLWRLLLQLPLRLNSLELLNAAAATRLAAHTALTLPDTPYVVCVRLEGSPEVMQTQQHRIADALPALRLSRLPVLQTYEALLQERLWAGLTQLASASGTGASEIVLMTSLRMSDLPAWCQSIATHAAAAGATWPLFAHAGSGIARLHIPLPEAALATPDRAIAHVQALDATLASLGGRRVIEWAPRAVKEQCAVWGTPGDDFALMRAIKTLFDPQHRLNPGRFIGGL